MKNYIEIVKKLFEMPGMTSDDDFGMSDELYNKKVYSQVINDQNKKIMYEDDYVILIQLGTNQKGKIYLLNKKREIIIYFVWYKTENIPLIGDFVTQTSLWRYKYAGGINITQLVIFDYLIPKFKTIMSDNVHTEDGMNFWKRLLDTAEQKGYEVGLVDFNNNTYQISSKEDGNFYHWLNDLNALGNDSNHDLKRFVIKGK